MKLQSAIALATLALAGNAAEFSTTQAVNYLVSTIAGGGPLPATSLAGLSAGIGSPQGAATDSVGNVYFSSGTLNAVFRLDTGGLLTRIAGTGSPGYSGDNGAATSAQLNNPEGVALDASGNLYIADSNNQAIRKVAITGTITTVAGNGTFGYSGDNGPATSANLNGPSGVAVDAAGNLYVADNFNSRIRKVSASGTITTLAGNGTAGYSGDNGPAASAELANPYGVAVDASGNLYIADTGNQRIRKVSTSGTIATVAGNGNNCCYSGDNGAATGAGLSNPYGVAVDASGNLYIADTSNNRIRMVAPNGIISTLAGSGVYGFGGDGGAAANASLNSPFGVAVDPFGNVYIADFSNRRIRKISAGTITTAAGGGTGDSGAAPFAGLNVPFGVVKDSGGNVYIADTINHRVRKISPAGLISTIAGTGVPGYSGDNGPATSAELNSPQGLAVDGSGNLYIADSANSRIRKVSTSGTITTVAGTGVYGYSGDNGPATSAELSYPGGVAVDGSGNLYIADGGNYRIRKVSSGGTITTAAGTGVYGYSGDNGPATSAQLSDPSGIAVDAAGNLYIADTGNSRIRKVSLSGTITTVAGTGVYGYSGDNGPATSAELGEPSGIAVDSSGNLYIADEGNQHIRIVAPGGIIGTLAGNGVYGYAGDGGLASNAEFEEPAGLTVDNAGNVYIADSGNSAVRLLTPGGGAALLSIVSSHSGSFTPGSGGQYTLTVTNAAFAGATSGTVTVTEIVPAGLTVMSMSGTGWSCGSNACTRSDSLAAGSSYTAIMVTVNIASPAPGQVTNQVTVAGGGAALAGAEDLTLMSGAAPAAPVLISPANGATGVSVSASLTWNSASAATSYDVRFGTSSPPTFLANTTATNYSPAGMVAGTTYYWQIVAKNSAQTTSSAIWSFTTVPSGSCSYVLNPTAGIVFFNGGTGSLSVIAPAGCSWTAVSSQSWLDVTSGASGAGNGTVAYSAGVNTAGPRSATLTIGGQTFTVTQGGAYLISTIAGGGEMPATSEAATAAAIGTPQGAATDSVGNVYFSSGTLNAVFRLDTSGLLTRIAGTGTAGYSGDNGAATSAQLNNPEGVAVDSSGNVYIADFSNQAIRKVAVTGTISTVAGNGGFAGYSGDNGPATSADLSGPSGVAVDVSGNLYIADSMNQRIRKVSTSGTITTVAGTGVHGYSGDNGPAASAELSNPGGVAVDTSGNLYIADTYNQRIRKVSTGGTITTVAGNGSPCCSLGDNGAATSAELSNPYGVAVDASENLYIADNQNNRVRMVAANGIISTLAGNGSFAYGGDGGAAASASLGNPFGVAVDPLRNVYIADSSNDRIRKVSAGTITTVAGGGTGDSGPAVFAGLNTPNGVVKDSGGNVYVAESSNHRVRKVTPAGLISTVAGTGVPGYLGDNGPASSAELDFPQGLAVDGSGNLYIADSNNQAIRKVSASGTITTVAGTGVYGYSGDNGTATSAQLAEPAGVAVDGSGNLYIADTGNFRIRKVSTGGTITTVAGTGVYGYSGDNGLAASAELAGPVGLAVDGAGNLYIADENNQAIRKVSTGGTITTVAGNGVYGYSGDNGPATTAELGYPSGVAVDTSGNLYIADESNERIRIVAPSGIIGTLAGNGVYGYAGDGGLASNAEFRGLAGLTVDNAGNIYIADTGSSAVRRLTPAAGAALLGIVSSHASNFTPGSSGQYTLTVTNAAFAGATSGTVTVAEIVPASLTLMSMSGTGWSCSTNTCTRSDSLAAGLSYPVITVTANIASPAPGQVTNQVTVAGGGAALAGAEDLTLMIGTAPAAPVQISPAYGATGISVSASLTWNSASAATSYDVYFGTSSPPPLLGNTTATSYSPAGMIAGTTYYWQIVAKNSAQTTSSAIWWFTTVPSGSCSYVLSPTAAGFSSTGGTGSLNVTAPAGCGWTAVSSQSWLDVTSGASGGGNGTVAFAAGANTAGPRSATLTIGQQTFTVTQAGAYLISTIAGGGALPATSLAGAGAAIGSPQGAATDSVGNVYFSSGALNAVFRLDTSGLLTRIAGNGSAGYSGDNGAATSAQLNSPLGVALDTSGNLYIADSSNARIRKVSTSGTITTVAGTGAYGFSGDNGPATSAYLNTPSGVAVDASGNLYIADTINQRIRKVSTSGTITTVAGNGTASYAGDNGPAASAELDYPYGVAVDASGNLYIADTGNFRIRKVSTGGTITTVAGNGSNCCSLGDSGPATGAELFNPYGIAVDASGNLYIADTQNNRVRMVAANGIITTLAGNGGFGYAGDGGAATGASLSLPRGVAVDPLGNVYIADASNNRIRKVSAGTITTAAGGGTGDSGPAAFAGLNAPNGVVKDSAGNVYIADSANYRVRKITPAGLISTVAGTGIAGYSGDSGPATSAELNYPQGLALDASGNLYIADSYNQAIRRVSTGGTITTVAGNGGYGYSGDHGPATGAQLAYPSGVAVDSSGNLYIADSNNQAIRKVSAGGTITTVAGTGVYGYSGDHGPATSAELASPVGVAVDGSGNLYIADQQNYRIRKVTTGGTITTVAGNGVYGYSGDGGPATSAEFNYPAGVAVDSSGNLYIADDDNQRIRVVASSGIIETLAGSGVYGYAGDGGLASNAEFQNPSGLTVDSTGKVYIADNGNSAVRLLTPAGGPAVLSVVSSHTGNFTPGSTGQYTLTVTNAAFAGPTSGTVTVAELVPAGLTLMSISGTGWSCSTNTCTRSDLLAAGSSYPAITVTVNIASPAPGQVTNQVTVAGGGAALQGGEDFTLMSGTAPAAPVLISPAYGATGVSVSASLTWNGASGATSYDVYFGTSSPPAFLANTTATSYSPAGMIAGTTYYWQIVAKNSAQTASSAIWWFTTAPSVSCTYLLSPTAVGFSSSGGTGSLTVTAPGGCGWTAVSSQSWLDVTFGASGEGNGTVAYSAGANTAGPRSATLTIGGQTFTVTQVGAYLISTIAGGALPATSEPGISAAIGFPQGAATDSAGNVYFTSGALNAVFRLDPSGLLTRIAGNGSPGYSGDNGVATSAQLNNPLGVALDASGNLYISDTLNQVIRKVSASGTITTVAGNGNNCCSLGDNGPATSANLYSPWGLAVDASGNLYIADFGNQRIRKVSIGGTITTVAGNGTAGYTGDNGPAANAELNGPSGVAVDASGNLYIADNNNQRIRKVFASGTITTVAGNGVGGYAGDNGAATSAELFNPDGVAVDASGNLYIADTNNDRVRMVAANGVISTFAGNGISTYGGDGGAAASASLSSPHAVAVDPFGNVYITDFSNNRLRKVSAGTITTAAGGGTGDSGPAVFAGLNAPLGVVKDGAGNVYIADTANNRVRKVTPTGLISTIAGTGVAGYSGDNGPATAAQLNYPQGLALDASGNLYIADSLNEAIRKISTSGTITTVAGTGVYGYSGDNGPATSAQLASPAGVALDGSGNLYIADASNFRVREVSTGGTITTVAGSGAYGYSGDNGPATSAALSNLFGVAVDGSGNLYIADAGNYRIRKVSASGTITTVAGTGVYGYSGDGGPAVSADLASPNGVAVDGSGNLYIADQNNQRIRIVAPGGIIGTLAGNGLNGYSGDGGLASNAEFGNPAGLTVDTAGNVYIADTGNSAVRLLTPGGSAALLSIVSSHTGSFMAGSSAQYTLTVSNAAFAGATSGTVTAAEIVPAGLTVMSMFGTGWNCGATTCTRSDLLAAGLSYPPITVMVSVASAPPVQVTNQATVSGGAAPTAGAEDFTVVTPAANALSVSGPVSLPVGTVNVTYAGATATATGGSGAYTWGATGLPGGLSIAPATGIISGTPTTSTGSPFTVIVTATDSNSVTASKTFFLTIDPALSITGAASLPAGTVNAAYTSTTETAIGGTGSYSWTATGLPSGLSIALSTGKITGTPSTSTGSPFSVTVTVTDSDSFTAAKSYTLTVNPALSVSGPSSLLLGTVNVTYAGATVTATGGSGSYTWAATGLPGGLSIASGTGVISGTPTTSTGSPFSVTVTATDGNSITASKTYSLTIDPALSITGAASLPVGTVNVAYTSTTETATGGTGSYTWTATGLPGGLSIALNTGIISGTPSSSTNSPFSVTVTVTDSGSFTATKSYSLTIDPALSITAPASLPVGTVSAAYTSTTVTATGGTGSYTWSATGLPGGLSIGPTTGIISGTPTTSTGSPFSVAVTATDGNSVTASKTYSLTIAPAGSITLSITGPASLPAGTVSAVYTSTTVTAAGGTGSYTWSATGLPSGLSIASSTGIISGTPTTSTGSPFTVIVTATDTNSATASKTYSLTIAPAVSSAPPVVTQQAEVLTGPRSTTQQPLLFSYVISANGFDTEITISNTSQDTLGSTPQSGNCSLNFYGSNPPAVNPQSTPQIAAGAQFAFRLSQGGGGIAAIPNFYGYVIATCGFPLARGFANTFGGNIGFAQNAQLITRPRSAAKPLALLFPFVTNQSGFDTGISISNTSSDPFGTTATSGACSVYFYGSSAPAIQPFVTPTIVAGSVYAGLASQLAPGFQGYAIANCNFSNAAGSAFVSDTGARVIALSEAPQLLTLPRSTATQPLLFSDVTNQNGEDTGITIANSSADPFGTTSASGSCTMNFYGSNAPLPVTTGTIAPGSVYKTLLSQIAPGFAGYIAASCFPQAQGWAYTGPSGFSADGDSDMAELVILPRSTSSSSLLFSAASNWNGVDTNITISNTSADPFGTTTGAGACTISYFGQMLSGGATPTPQVSNSVPAGGQLSFTLSQGNVAQGIAGAPGFRGYVIADCGFPLARGLAAITGTPPGDTVEVTVGTSPSVPAITITVDGTSHAPPQTFNWVTGSTHTVGATVATNGATQYVFSNWSSGGTLSHSVTAPASNAAYTVNFQASQYSSCDLKQTGSPNVVDVQLIINEALGAPVVYDLSGTGTVNVVDVQIEINAALGLGCSGQ